MLMFEIKYETDLNLYLWIGPSSQEIQKTRQRLKDIADDNRVSGVSMRQSKRLAKGFHYLYRKQVLSQEDFRSSDADVANKVDLTMREFFEKDYWLMVNAVREEFGLLAVDSIQASFVS